MDQKTSLIDKSNLPIEKGVDCANCRMCGNAGGKYPYDQSLKCCTYYPFLPNYSVGAILEHGGEGAARVKDLVRNRQWSLPIGLVAPPSYQVRFRNKKPEEFGRNPNFQCPFLDRGLCTVWKFRNSECSTYFCNFADGESGKAKWSEISDKIFSEEMEYSQNLMLHHGYLWPEVEHNLEFIKFLPDEISSTYLSYSMESRLWVDFWKHWSDRPEEYYKSCWYRINQK